MTLQTLSGNTPLLNLLWRFGCLNGQAFTASGGEFVEIVSSGEYEGEAGIWNGAEIIVDGERRYGSVSVGSGAPVTETAVLRVVEKFAMPVLGFGDRLVAQIEYRPGNDTVACYDRLKAGAHNRLCAAAISVMDSLRRTDLFTKLTVDRLRRKSGEIAELYARLNRDWNQTFYTMLLRSMGGDRNCKAFTELASRVTYVMVSREKSSQTRVEALLLGASGFLAAASEKDPFTIKMEGEFRHLANKYSVIPLRPAEWELDKIYPHNHPVVRLMEIAALLSKKEFMLGSMLSCRTAADVEKLFAAEASEYWNTHYTPGAESTFSPKRIGRSKSYVVGINLVVPLMFAYGKETADETLCERALDLLETIPAESNRKLNAWKKGGCIPESGFESQAILQLDGRYCAGMTCTECPVGRNEIKKNLTGLDLRN